MYLVASVCPPICQSTLSQLNRLYDRFSLLPCAIQIKKRPDRQTDPGLSTNFLISCLTRSIVIRHEGTDSKMPMHRFTYPKGVHSYRYFLPSNSYVICSCIYAFCLRIAIRQPMRTPWCTHTGLIAIKMHTCMSR